MVSATTVNGGLVLSLSGLGVLVLVLVLALPPPDPPCLRRDAAMPLDCGKQPPPHTWHDDLCGFLKLFVSKRRVDGLKPAAASTCLWTAPRAQAYLRGRAWVTQSWAESVGGAVRLRGPTLARSLKKKKKKKG